MALPDNYDELIARGDANADAWRRLGGFLGDRPGWRFMTLPPAFGSGLWAHDQRSSRLEIRPWAGRYETTVNFLLAGDDTQIFFDDFDELVTWLINYGEQI